MPVITLPDGSQRSFDQPVTVADIAADIGPGLARAALAGRVDGRLVDLTHEIDTDAELALITGKDDEGLEIIRHSTAHLLAQAVKSVFPKAQVTIGPVIEDGFFYDFAFERAFTPEDLTVIEKEMEKLAKADLPVTREVMSGKDAIAYFKSIGEHYKAEIIADITGPGGNPFGKETSDELSDAAARERGEVSIYCQGEWKDLCRGPHVPSTGKLKAFKLMKLAGAYWRGDSKNEMLQRIYGTAWPDKNQLKDYLHRLEEAEKRDHRKIGKVMDLFHSQEDAPGMVFWHDKGWRIWQTIETYLREKLRDNGYQEVRTPQILDSTLWEKSGHAGKYAQNMFITGSEDREFAIKPMNCPCHVQIYNHTLHSYRDLPLRMAEFGSCHRNEPSGTLHGLMRVRNFTQDDAHIFCTEEQILPEAARFMDLLFEVYRDFGFDKVDLELSTRPESRVGTDEQWDRAEQVLTDSLEASGHPYVLNEGDGAFYGPKIDFSLKDSIGRVWQLGTLQLDFSMPERLGATYVDEHSEKQTVVMLHRAILGSLERFIGILIEHYAGQLPLWLAPVQAVVLGIADRHSEYAEKAAETLKNQGFRVNSDLRNEKIGFKIREHTIHKIPYMLVVGDRELENESVAVRTRSGEDLGSMKLDEFAEMLADEIASRGRSALEE